MDAQGAQFLRQEMRGEDWRAREAQEPRRPANLGLRPGSIATDQPRIPSELGASPRSKSTVRGPWDGEWGVGNGIFATRLRFPPTVDPEPLGRRLSD